MKKPLKIVVLAKQVPDTRNVGKDAMTPEGTVNRAALPAIFNPEDLNAHNDAYYFNGRWETFGGLNWQVNKKLSLGCSVVNFLNQTGAKGSIAGAELVTKEEAGKYANTVMAGSYIRPFTVEFSAQLKF